MKYRSVYLAVGLCALLACLAWFANDLVVTQAASNSGETDLLSGELEVVAECEETDGRVLYYIKSGDEKVRVTFDKAPEQDLETGMQLTVSGTRTGKEEFVANEKSMQIAANVSEAVVSGEIKVLVYLVNFRNSPTQPYTVAGANSLMFDAANPSSVTNYYREASYGKAWVTGTTVGWYTLPMDASTAACDQNSTISSLAKQAATAAGVNINNYQKHMIVFPNMGCSYSGRGQIGGTDTWIDGSLILRTTAHELGHNLGLYHSQAMSCSSIISGTCTTYEYGHNSDMIGQTSITGHFHPYQKEKLGWLNASGVPPIQLVSGAGTYTVSGLSVQDNNPKALKVLASGTTYYYVEFRRPVGFDSFVSNNSDTMNGVLITRDSSASENYLLDMVPSTASWSDAALKVGQSFTDPNINMTITVASVSSAGAVLNVTYGSSPCTTSAPTVSADPATMQWLVPGAVMSYKVTVRNNNSTNCSASTFTVGATVPAGWSSSSTQVDVASGGSTSAFVTVSPSVSSPTGYYSVNIVASNGSFAASTPRDLSVFSTLGVSAEPGRAVYSSGSTVTLSSAVSANGTPVSGVVVTFAISKPGAGRVRPSTVVVTAVTGADGRAVYSYRMSRKQDPAGTYSVTATSSFGGASGSGQTSFEVR
ncbi:MAG TPA: hypothetical protein VJV05_04285 [Pyrinomonadaceae bacterium]|nr:hypothetical protein [Pyrinomonadaceae bacterium]